MSKKLPLNNIPADKQFSTYDLGVSAAILALGFTLLDIQRTYGNKCLFIFKHSDALVNAAQNYWQGNLNVDALTYWNCIKTLKNQIYSI